MHYRRVKSGLQAVDRLISLLWPYCSIICSYINHLVSHKQIYCLLLKDIHLKAFFHSKWVGTHAERRWLNFPATSRAEIMSCQVHPCCLWRCQSITRSGKELEERTAIITYTRIQESDTWVVGNAQGHSGLQSKAQTSKECISWTCLEDKLNKTKTFKKEEAKFDVLHQDTLSLNK